jgi:hypothetical protein
LATCLTGFWKVSGATGTGRTIDGLFALRLLEGKRTGDDPGVGRLRHGIFLLQAATGRFFIQFRGGNADLDTQGERKQ